MGDLPANNVRNEKGGTCLPGNCVAVKDTSDVALFDLEVTACAGGAIELHRSARVTVEGCRVHHNPLNLATITSDHNLVWSPDHDQVIGWPLWNVGTLAQYQASNPQGWDASSLQADPLLREPGTADFALSFGSPAIDSGDDAHAAATDVTGIPRPQDGDGDGTSVCDRGAYELVLEIFADGFESGDTSRWSVTAS